MASLSDIVRTHTDLGPAETEHLRRLVGAWGPLADLCFADLLLFTTVRGDDADRLVSLGQIRPTTTQTMHYDDMMGRFVELSDRPMIRLAFDTGQVVEQEVELVHLATRAKVMAVPVRYNDRVIAVMTRESPNLGHRPMGDLELAYLNVFERLAQMIAEGAFPFPFEDPVTEVTPRVGDGALILDRNTAVVYSSPNAVSAFHRLGFHGTISGRRLEDLGFRPESARTLLTLKAPVVEEVERGDVTILARVVPLLTEGEVDGALALLRDVSELRSRERLLVSMDATIREIHHRVKNNLQTVSSLLRLQGRRVSAPEAKEAIAEAERRVISIAAVHDLLAREGGDEVLFSDVVRPILAMAIDPTNDSPIQIKLVGDGPVLRTNTASSLAVVLNELVQNSVEHGYPPGSKGGSITVELLYDASELVVRVHDDGVGVPEDFDIESEPGLGLTIINTLVRSELSGTLSIRPATGTREGTVAELTVRLDS
ncbi:MAG: histidine kinase N-terminal domain-containing protein [Actinomycetota bacterium]